MEVIYERVAGLDVHKDSVVACIRTHLGRTAERECRSFGTTTDELVALRDWLTAAGCQLAAMEATGVYWMPIYKILVDGDLTLLVANAAHIKGIAGRKTDMNDAVWIADLAACGLIKASFVPEEDVQEMRTLMRTRKQLVREQTSHAQRVQKTLTEANIRLDSVISDIMGLNGRRMIEAMIGGLRDPRKLAALADRRLKATSKQLYDALHGRLTDHHRFLLKLHLAQWDALDVSVQAIDSEVDARLARTQAASPGDDPELAPSDEQVKDEEVKADKARFSELIDLLSTIPGVGRLSALTIVSEIGPDMSRFPTAGHLVAWAGMCPGQNESAGKKKGSRLRKGAPWLKTMLVQCAWAATRAKASYYRAQFFRLRARRGPQKAICAVAASILTAIYHMIKNGTPHHDLGIDYFERRAPETKTKRLTAQLKQLGYQVTLTPLPKAA
jgi:transposase